MNTEREALELARKVLIEVVEADEQAIAELNHIGQTVAEPAVTAKCRHAIASILSALANKPEASEPVSMRLVAGDQKLDWLDYNKVDYDVMIEAGYELELAYSSPSTAALQKRIEELEAQLANKNEIKPVQKSYPRDCPVSDFHCSYPECVCGR